MSAAALRRRQRRVLDIWPGFVDALATLLIIVIFTLLIFVIAQFYLTETLTGRNEALVELNRQINELGDLLALEKSKSSDLEKSIAAMSLELRSTLNTRDDLKTSLASVAGRADEAERALEENSALLDAQEQQLQEQAIELERERQLSDEARSMVALLNQQIAALRRQLAAVEEALDAEEAKVADQKLKIDDLGTRLNIALAAKVEALEQYRSEFFGRLREVLGQRSDIQIVGDRFVFQSEVLFNTGQARLEPQGRERIASLATTLKEIAGRIPEDIDWILRVDGHTDDRPIQTAEFPSNWELSTARALSVVKFMIEQGIPPHRLAATGFGEFQPIDRAKTDDAFRRNRRIELKLDQR